MTSSLHALLVENLRLLEVLLLVKYGVMVDAIPGILEDIV